MIRFTNCASIDSNRCLMFDDNDENVGNHWSSGIGKKHAAIGGGDNVSGVSLLQIPEWVMDFRVPCNRIAIDPTCDHDLVVGERGRSFAA